MGSGEPRFLAPSVWGLGFEDLLRGRDGEVEDRTIGSGHKPELESLGFEIDNRRSPGDPWAPLCSGCPDVGQVGGGFQNGGRKGVSLLLIPLHLFPPLV